MPHRKLFLPDQALVFRTLPEEVKLIHEMRRHFDKLCGRGHEERDAFYFSYVLTHRDDDGITTAVGASEFYRRMIEYLRSAMDMVETVIADYFRPFAGRLPAHNAVANCLDPIQMLRMATTNPGGSASSLERRLHFESLRQLGIAMQLFAIENVDGEAAVAEDLTHIDRLTWERLFTPGLSLDLWIVAFLDPKQNRRATAIRVFHNRQEAKHSAREWRRAGESVYEELYPCRVAPNARARYIVMVENRRKRLFATLLKLYRGRRAGDRRGWKYVVTGLQNGDGILRVAAREDAEAFAQHTLDSLWRNPLIQEEDDAARNPESNPDYWDVKTVGRFHREFPDRRVAGPVEQIVTTLHNHLGTVASSNGLNHELYRARQVARHMGPLWFPHRRGPYEDITTIRLPGFGVEWDSDYFIGRLEHWWMSQLQL